MAERERRRGCQDCPYGGWAEPGSQHVRCARCRADHARAKAADAQWDRRARRRAEANDRRRRLGLTVADESLIRPRERTPAWDQFGREIGPSPRLTPSQAETLRGALDRLDRAVADVRRALDPPRR